VEGIVKLFSDKEELAVPMFPRFGITSPIKIYSLQKRNICVEFYLNYRLRDQSDFEGLTSKLIFWR